MASGMAPSRSTLAAVLGAGAMLCLATPVLAATKAPMEMSIARIQSDLPVGIRIGLVRPVAAPVRGAVQGRDRAGQAVAFADSAGRPLYFSDAACAADCLERWKPALAEANAVPTAHFTVVNHAGQRQWAFQGKPLYTPVNSDSLSDPLELPLWDALRPPRTLGMEVRGSGEDGMKLALVNPKSWIKMPYSIGVAEYRLAPGQVLAVGVAGNNPMGKPLYTFSGTAQEEKALPAVFRPHYAAALSLGVGDFSVRTRTDDTPQWAYKGAPLYTCDCDVSVGDLNGEGLASGIAPAVAFAYANPKEVVVKKDPLSIGRMVEASTGRTLYFRDRLEDDYQPDNTRPLLGTHDAKVGAMLGLAHCDAKCEKEWRPLFAPKDAKPHGYWTIYDRPDGKRQWAYKNYALYTYLKEGPGRLDGNEKYLVQFEDGTGSEALPKEFGLGLNWRAAVP